VFDADALRLAVEATAAVALAIGVVRLPWMRMFVGTILVAVALMGPVLAVVSMELPASLVFLAIGAAAGAGGGALIWWARRDEPADEPPR
jgi:hypothetical protein